MSLGTFIVLDGPDGSGTTLHTRLLSEKLQSEGRAVMLTAEPTSGPIGTWVREQLHNHSNLPAEALQLLFTADRAAHVRDVIFPALAAGKDIICDRYTYSTIAYGEAAGLDAQWLAGIQSPFPVPTCTIFALPSIDVCFERLARRESRDMFEKRDLQERVHASYHRMAKHDSSINVIDTAGEKAVSAEKIWQIVRGRISA